jgi:diaminopimelate epimerase
MSKIISFIKMHGAGNDFVFIEEKKSISKKKALAVELCRRQFGIGADGAVFWKKTGAGKYKWDFYNADGSDADFCGNAARALVKLLILEKKIKPTQSVQISTQAGLMIGKRVGKLIEVQMPVFPKAAKVKGKTIIHSGVPHLLIPWPKLERGI